VINASENFSLRRAVRIRNLRRCLSAFVVGKWH